MSVRCSIHTQVSKYEKFGYGCMVTQLASTQAGIAELNNCGERSVVFLLCVVDCANSTCIIHVIGTYTGHIPVHLPCFL